MITLDILSPVGGRNGGIENVIRLWTENLDPKQFSLRVIHMAPGMRYLGNYDKAYAFTECEEQDINKKLQRFVQNYVWFIRNYGSPDICIAVNWPVMCLVADTVRTIVNGKFKILSWVHSRIGEYEKAGLGGIRQMICADAHLCISRNNENRILAEDGSARTYLVANPIVLQQFVEKPEQEHLLCYVGRLQDVKRVDIILEALYRAVNKWQLRIIGDGEETEELKKIVAYLHQEAQVEFLGWKSNPWDFCRDASALVAASEYEGFMLSGAEALSMGMTVISTPVEGLIDYVRPGINGYLFRQEDAVGLAQILDMIYEGRLPLCDRKVCRQSVEKYSIENYFMNIVPILHEVLQ